jgi:hypothetical protein
VARAAHGIPWLAHMKRDTLGGELVFYNPASVVAYGIARLKGDNFGRYERNTDPRFSWRQPKSENDLRESLLPEGSHHKYIAEGGAWRRFAAMEHAKLIGDIATCERLEREQKAEMDKLTEEVRAAFAGMPQRRRPQRPPIVGYRLAWSRDGKWHEQRFASWRAGNKVARENRSFPGREIGTISINITFIILEKAPGYGRAVVSSQWRLNSKPKRLAVINWTFISWEMKSRGRTLIA